MVARISSRIVRSMVPLVYALFATREPVVDAQGARQLANCPVTERCGVVPHGRVGWAERLTQAHELLHRGIFCARFRRTQPRVAADDVFDDHQHVLITGSLEYTPVATSLSPKKMNTKCTTLPRWCHARSDAPATPSAPPLCNPRSSGTCTISFVSLPCLLTLSGPPNGPLWHRRPCDSRPSDGCGPWAVASCRRPSAVSPACADLGILWSPSQSADASPNAVMTAATLPTTAP